MLGLGSKNTDQVIGLDIGSWSVKGVALQSVKGRLSLQGFAHQPIGEQEPAAVVRKVLDQMGVKPRQVVTAVSGRSVIVRQVQTPRMGQGELRNHILYEADKFIPFAADEVVIDCQPLHDPTQDKDGQMQVLLVAARQSVIDDHLSMLHAAGVRSDVIDVDVFAVCNAFTALGPVPQVGAEGATALVDIGAAKTWVAIVKGQRPLFQREIYLAGNEITEAIGRGIGDSVDSVEALKLHPTDNIDQVIEAAMPAFEDLANEIRLSFDYVDGQFDEAVNQVVLTGGSSLLPTISEVLGNILNKPVSVLDPLAGLDLIPSKYDLHSLEDNAPALTVALGLACHLAAGDIRGLGGSQLAAWNANRAGKLAKKGGGSGLKPAIVAPPPEPMSPPPAVGTNPPATRSTPPSPASIAPLPSFPTPLPDAPAGMGPLPATPSSQIQPPTIPVMKPAQPATSFAPPPTARPASEGMAILPSFLDDTQESQPQGDSGSANIANPIEEIDARANRSSILVVLDDDQEMPPQTKGFVKDEDPELPPLPGEGHR